MKSHVLIDRKMLLELNIKNFILSGTCAVVGLGGTIASIILMMLHIDMDMVAILIASIFLFVVGVGFIIFVLVVLKKAAKNNVTVDVDFLDDVMMVRTIFGEEEPVDQNITYEDVYYYKESSHYFFISASGKDVCPVNKSEELRAFLTSKGINKR